MDAGAHRSEKMRRVESGVLLEPALRSHAPDGRPLDERMVLYGVPGVSVAVIADGDSRSVSV